jgi:hypothetical protein
MLVFIAMSRSGVISVWTSWSVSCGKADCEMGKVQSRESNACKARQAKVQAYFRTHIYACIKQEKRQKRGGGHRRKSQVACRMSHVEPCLFPRDYEELFFSPFLRRTLLLSLSFSRHRRWSTALSCRASWALCAVQCMLRRGASRPASSWQQGRGRAGVG